MPSFGEVVEFRLGDVVRLRRVHPCGNREWLVDRLGADIGLRCTRCGRHVLLDRRTLERRLEQFVERGDEALTRAVSPAVSSRRGAADSGEAPDRGESPHGREASGRGHAPDHRDAPGNAE